MLKYNFPVKRQKYTFLSSRINNSHQTQLISNSNVLFLLSQQWHCREFVSDIQHPETYAGFVWKTWQIQKIDKSLHISKYSLENILNLSYYQVNNNIIYIFKLKMFSSEYFIISRPRKQKDIACRGWVLNPRPSNY